MRSLFTFCAGFLLWLMGCEMHSDTTTQKQLPVPPVVAVASAPVPPPDTADCTRAWAGHMPGPADTLVAIGTRHYWLAVQVATDSTRALDYDPATNVGAAFAAPSDSAAAAGRVRGYYETYTFTLRDSTKHTLVFRRQLHKPDFYRLGSRDIVTVMNLERPSYLGYSAALNALVFRCDLWIPSSDVGVRATLVLDRQGHLRTISPGGAILWEAADCDPQLSPDGRAVLTCTELLRAGRPPLQLQKPHAALQAARFLNDSTLLTIYEYGDFVPSPTVVSNDASVTAPMTEGGWVATPAQRRQPTAVLLRTSGRVLRQFDLKTTGDAACELPRAFEKSSRTYFFFDENSRKLVLLPKTHPDNLAELPLKRLSVFKPPLHPRERKLVLESAFSRLRLYIDTLHPQVVRYQLRRKLTGP